VNRQNDAELTGQLIEEMACLC